MEAPPLDPDDWSDEQWQAHLRASAAGTGPGGDDEDDGDDQGAVLHRRLRSSAVGTVTGAAMMGLQQALYGELPAQDVVIEAESDDPDRDRSVFDPDDPSAATISLVAEPPTGHDD